MRGSETSKKEKDKINKSDSLNWEKLKRSEKQEPTKTGTRLIWEKLNKIEIKRNKERLLKQELSLNYEK